MPICQTIHSTAARAILLPMSITHARVGNADTTLTSLMIPWVGGRCGIKEGELDRGRGSLWRLRGGGSTDEKVRTTDKDRSSTLGRAASLLPEKRHKGRCRRQRPILDRQQRRVLLRGHHRPHCCHRPLQSPTVAFGPGPATATATAPPHREHHTPPCPPRAGAHTAPPACPPLPYWYVSTVGRMTLSGMPFLFPSACRAGLGEPGWGVLRGAAAAIAAGIPPPPSGWRVTSSVGEAPPYSPPCPSSSSL